MYNYVDVWHTCGEFVGLRIDRELTFFVWRIIIRDNDYYSTFWSLIWDVW